MVNFDHLHSYMWHLSFTAYYRTKPSQVIRSVAPVTQNHLSKAENLMLQNAAPLRKSAP